MKFRGPMGGGAASGSLGAMTASHNSGGQYLRARTVPTNPRTDRQIEVRNALATLAQNYSDVLTQPERDGWAVYGQNGSFFNSLGDAIKLSGIGAFIRNNGARAAALDAIVTTPPAIFVDTALVLPVPTATAPNTLSVAFTNTDEWATAVGGHLYSYVGRPQSAGVNFYAGPYRFLGAIDGAVSPPTSPQGFTFDVLDYGVMTAGQKLFWRFVAVSADGRISPILRATTVVL